MSSATQFLAKGQDVSVLADLVTEPTDLLKLVSGTVCTAWLGDRRLSIGTNEPSQVEYLRALFLPGNALWSIGAPEDLEAAAVGLVLPAPDFRALVAEIRRRAHAAVPVRMHVHAPATQYVLSEGPAAVRATFAEPTSAADGPALVVHSARGLVCVSTHHPYGHLNFGRQLREYGYRRAEDNHWVGFHASCARLPDGTGAVIVGRSGAGKSTVSLALAGMGGAAGFVANDRVMVGRGREVPQDGPLRALAMPVPIRLNGGTVHALGLASAVRWDLMRPQPDYENSDWENFGGDSKLSVLADEWRQRTGTRLVDEVQLGAVVLPRAQPTGGPVRVRPADPAEAMEILSEQCMLPDDETFVEDWLSLRGTNRQVLVERARAMVRRLAQLPAIIVEFGVGTELGQLAAAIARGAAGQR